MRLMIIRRVFCMLGILAGISQMPAMGQETQVVQPAAEEVNVYVSRELERVIRPMLIGERPPLTPTERMQAAVRTPQTDPILAAMYEGMDLVLDEEYEEAIPLLEYVIANEPTLIPVWSTLGWTYWRVDRREDALRLWSRFLQLDPTHATAHLLVGNAYIGIGQLEKGEYHLRRSLAINPEQIEPQMALATVYRWTGRYAAAISILEDLREVYPDRLDIQNELGITLFQNARYAEAMPLLEQGVRALPNDRQLTRLHALCLLRTGNLTEARLRARRLLREDNADLELLLLLADAPLYSGDLEEALPYLEQVADSDAPDEVRSEALTKIITIRRLLAERDPRAYPIEEALPAAAELVEIDPRQSYWRLSQAELLLMSKRYEAAARGFGAVMDLATTNVLAARAGQFELAQATTRYGEGRDHLEYIRSVNPTDPYLFEKAARLEMARGNVRRAYEMLDHLETAGAQGAVAVLLYYGLGDSDWSDVMSVRRFRLHLAALKQAGYRFLRPSEIDSYFEALPEPPEELSEHRPERAVVITFDRIDERTMRLATEVAEDLDLVFGVHLAARDMLDTEADAESIDAIRKMLRGGHWELGSLLHDAIQLQPVREDGRLGSILSARKWLADEEMFEDELAFARRLRFEYAESRKKLREWAGPDFPVDFMAYPYGDFGLGVMNNVEDAHRQNLLEGVINYRMGFTQSVYGHAVKGDNPLLYQRYTPAVFMDGPELVGHLISHHPVYLARRMRSEFAALRGELIKAQRNLALLRRDNFPTPQYDKAEAFVYRHLALKFGVARQIEPSVKGPFELEIRKPFAGGEFMWFKDSLERRNWRNSYYAGMYVTPAITVEARAGFGRYRQRFTENLAGEDETPDLVDRELTVGEQFAGVHAGLRYQPRNPRRSPITLGAGVRQHEYDRDADFENMAWFVQSAFRPVLYYDVLLGVEQDVIPSARSLTEEVTQDRYYYAGALRIRDWWDIWSRVAYNDISDGNTRIDADISTIWEIVPSSGLLAGLEYGYVDAEFDRDDYWTPYQLRQYFLVGRIRNNINRFSYDLGLKIGRARERVRREDQEAYERLVERAERFRFDPGDAPNTEWEDIFAVNAVISTALGRYWRANWEGSYTESANYHEYRSVAGLHLQF